MKAPDGYFQRKNSKKGLALSTSMAICIVLAILVAVLVSMATLNITTTQATVSQREAYIQAKSALAFAESYYSQHDIPGKDEENGGEALIVFNGSVVSQGAKVYVTKLNGTVQAGINEDKLKADCPDTYVEVLKSGDYLDLTAHCKYGDNNYYELSKEFNLGNEKEAQPNSFTGNITYQATSDTRYLRIHVRTNPAFNGYPFLYTWYTSVNNTTDDKQFGKSSIVNKMSDDKSYATISNGKWDGKGPGGNCAMIYEGNGWYVTEVKVGTNTNVNFVNAIVTRNGAARSANNTSQSWEFFGIPLPNKDNPGASNGLDVYITLNRNELRDARNYNKSLSGESNITYDVVNSTDSMSAAGDELTQIFEATKGVEACSGDVNQFAQFCGSWYTVYTKKDTYIMHYRKQGVYDNSAGPGGALPFEYEGYGWWRCTSYNSGDSVKGISFGSANTISQNQYGKEIIKEGFVAELDDASNTTRLFASEAEANEFFATEGKSEGLRAGDYLTVNVKGSRQPVNEKKTTTITYTTKWDTGKSTDTDTTPTPSGTASSTKEKLEFKNLASGDGGVSEFVLIGDSKLNNWGLTADESDHLYENLDYDKFKLTQRSGELGIFEIQLKNCQKDTYTFKVIERKKNSGSIDTKDEYGNNGWTWSYGRGDDSDGNTVHTVQANGNTLIVVFDANQRKITEVKDVDPGGPIEDPDDYGVIGWCNDWGTKSADGTLTYSQASFDAVDKMTFDPDAGVYTYVADRPRDFVESNKSYTFKIVKMSNTTGPVDYSVSYPSDNYSFTPPLTVDGKVATCKAIITFHIKTLEIDVDYEQTGVAGQKFYVIGNFNNWASDHTFNVATNSNYEFESTGETDENGRYIYTCTPDTDFDVGDHEVKVISSNSLKSGANANDKNSINYDVSWGETDGMYETYGSVKSDGSNRNGFSFEIGSKSSVKFTFYYDPTNFRKSIIQFTPVAKPDDPGSVTFKFKNDKGKDENGKDTEFTSAWENLYVTYYNKTTGLPNCKQVAFSDGTKIIKFTVPKDADKFYLSNMDSINDSSDPNFRRTVMLMMDTVPANRTLTPTHLEDGSSDTWKVIWESGRSAEEQPPKTETMVYSGSLHNNYYDAPLVKVLNMLVSGGKADGGGKKYAFSAYPYSSYDVKNSSGEIKASCSFSTSNFVTYQGEKYYYDADKSYNGYSFLIVQDSSTTKTGYLLENHMALMSDIRNIKDSSGHVIDKMNNRGGGVFTSDEKYYDGSKSEFNYGGYTPNWYTFKIPVTTEVKIDEIKGLVDPAETIIDNGDYIEPANVNDYYKQPLYIVQEYANTTGTDQVERFYTYNTDIGSVDTTTSNTVSVYFDNSGSGDAHFDKVCVYAYDPLGNHNPNYFTTELPIDGTDKDHNYYRFEFDAGQYCYFVFFDPTSGTSIDDVTKKTEILYFTGNENSSTHEYDILARGGDAKVFSPYVHPKTQALYAAIALESATAASRIASSYSYKVATGEYEITSTYEMTGIKEMAEKARKYANDGDGGWSATDPTAYNELASTVQEFVETIQNARVYIADTVPDVDPSSSEVKTGDRIFKEGSYKDDTFVYQKRWVDRLFNVYKNAVSAFDDEGKQNVTQLRTYINDLNNMISSPLIDWNVEAVQIIVDDQVITKTQDDGTEVSSGGWGKSSIHLYNCDADGKNWGEVGYDLYDTTQSSEGFYAYVFKLKLATNNYAIGNSIPADGDKYTTMSAGQRYIFHTATNTLELDKSIATYRITDTSIAFDDDATKEYNKFDVRDGDKSFVIYFLYDTKVKTKDHGTYTIRAGAYTITEGYAGYSSDLESEGKKGIDLFSDKAKDFFTTPGNYGMSLSSSTDYLPWSVDIPDEGKNIDIMCSQINKTSSISAKTSSNKKIGFRYNGEKGNDTLKLNQNVSFDGGTVVIAVNSLDLNSAFDTTIKAKTIVFKTDTIVTTTHGDVKISHGTYTLNNSDSTTGFTVSLQTTGASNDWRKHYTLVSETGSKLRGGYYIAHK